MSRFLYRALLAVVLVSMVLVTPAWAAVPQPQTPQTAATLAIQPAAATRPQEIAPNQVVTVTLMHTNDFHGNLQLAGSNPGIARTAYIMFTNTVVPTYTLYLDAGDIMQGTLLSNLFHGESTIDVYNQVGYDVATFGNHEFDWGQDVLLDRTSQAAFPFVSANIVVSDTGSCDTAGWTPPPFVAAPWVSITLGVAPDDVVIGIIGVTSQETPYITVDWATAGLCFKDPAESIAHYWAEMDATVDAIVVLSHLGLPDGGYGYGFPVYGDRTLADRLIDGGTPAHLIIGGHSHIDMPAAEVIGNGVISTTVAQAHYAGRKVGMYTLAIDKDTGAVGVSWQRLVVSPSGPEDAAIKAAVDVWANDPWYQGEIGRVIGYTAVTITRNYNGDSLMGYFVNDAIYNDLNNDAEPLNDVDMVFNNAGGLRADFTFPVTATYPQTITHGMMYSVLPFGNQTIVGDMTGAQIVELLNQSATLFKGALQPAGVRYGFYRYGATPPGQWYQWGVIDPTVWNPDTSAWEPIDAGRTYRVATNEFLAPAGQDGFTPFKYMTNISYWGDMLDGAERWVSATYSLANPYAGALDGRITRYGDDTTGPVVPVTILHHNDQHGRLLKSGTNPGWTQLATLVTQERAFNPDRTLLLNAGDTIQGDSMSYYFKSAGLGYAADGTPIVTETMQIQPAIAVMNEMDYTAFVLGNHEFNFGSQIFTSVFGLADFPVLGSANAHDDGRYGFAEVGVEPYITVSVPVSGTDPIAIAILGIANHRVPNYELPSNIVGLSFTNPISEAQALIPGLAAANDAVVALTHIGFTTNPGSVEVDNNVDTYLAAQTSGLAAIVGGHSHTDPSKQTSASGDYLYLPAVVGDVDGNPVLVTQAYRYNNYLGEVILGFIADGMGGYKMVAQAGRYIKVDASTVVEDPTILGIVQPYQNMLNAYNETEAGVTDIPIDATRAFTMETNAANFQADASVAELRGNGVTVDFHLSGAMTNRAIAAGATVTDPVTITVADMFTLMPYENSLLTIQMNGPQLKAVLERAYRNYYYYKYVPGYGGYSYYTTCMLDTNAGNQIVYRDSYPDLPDGHNVVELNIGGEPVDFNDAATYYDVSTVNYLAAGSCNFNDDGVSLWPLDQIVADTQYYVRDAVINYTMEQGFVSPQIEGRLQFLFEPCEAVTDAAFSWEPSAPLSYDTITFAGVATGTELIDYVWDLGDGTTAIGPNPQHLYVSAGDYTVVMTATNCNPAPVVVTHTVSVTARYWDIYLPLITK